jgi:hypothetical protein
MITQVTFPNVLNPARNPVPLVLQTDNWIVTPGVTAHLKFGFTSGAVAGDHLVLEWDQATVDFEFVAVPDDSGGQLPAYSSGSLIAWVHSP